jgi:PIN domain nuclease of toxin-antitoxin system
VKRLLLDTHVLLWWLSDDPQLGASSRQVIANPRNPVYVSAASAWEISIKKSIGKLTAPDDMDAIVENEGFEKLPITLFHGDQAGALPELHKDPFDRMLIAQAQSEGLVIVTNDEKIIQYKIRTMDARK